MAADALVTLQSPAAMGVLIASIWVEQVLAFHEEGFQQTSPFQYPEMTEHAYICKSAYEELQTWVPFYKHLLTIIPAWISNHMPSKVWDEIIYPFPNFNGATIEVWEWISNSISYIIMDVIIYPY